MRIKKYASKIIGWVFIISAILTIVNTVVFKKPLDGFDIALFVLLQASFGLGMLAEDKE